MLCDVPQDWDLGVANIDLKIDIFAAAGNLI